MVVAQDLPITVGLYQSFIFKSFSFHTNQAGADLQDTFTMRSIWCGYFLMIYFSDKIKKGNRKLYLRIVLWNLKLSTFK